jgi:SNF family Na+-dependent transporter
VQEVLETVLGQLELNHHQSFTTCKGFFESILDSTHAFHFILEQFRNNVINARENILDGIGLPNLKLFGFLVLAWAVVFLILLKGIQSTGKAAYVLAVFPYVILVILLIRALTLEGSMKGIKYLFKPQWDKILDPKVW